MIKKLPENKRGREQPKLLIQDNEEKENIKNPENKMYEMKIGKIMEDEKNLPPKKMRNEMILVNKIFKEKEKIQHNHKGREGFKQN